MQVRVTQAGITGLGIVIRQIGKNRTAPRGAGRLVLAVALAAFLPPSVPAMTSASPPGVQPPANHASSAAGPTLAAGMTECGRVVGPDVIVADLHDVWNYPSLGDIDAFAVGTISCNVGDEDLLWVFNTNQHPVIGQNMYRLKGHRFEQIGMSWVKHGFNALTQNLCGCGCNGHGGDRLGVGCSDPYEAFTNGIQNYLGPRFEINPYTGVFPFPHTARDVTGDSIYKRLQVKISDLDPAQDGGGQYFVEGQYVTPDDAAHGNQANNASYRPITLMESAGEWSADVVGVTIREQPAIYAWGVFDSGVSEWEVLVPDDGVVIVAARAEERGGGLWAYEYAVQNLYCDRGIGSITVPVGIGADVSSIGFHDVDYHSGEPFDDTDWPGVFDGQRLTWATTPHAVNVSANALRWGTLYNFRFTADLPPGTGTVRLGLFKPGAPDWVEVSILAPATGVLCATASGDGDSDCDVDLADYARLQICLDDGGIPYDPACACFDVDTDLDVDLADVAMLANWSGPGSALPDCASP